MQEAIEQAQVGPRESKEPCETSWIWSVPSFEPINAGVSLDEHTSEDRCGEDEARKNHGVWLGGLFIAILSAAFAAALILLWGGNVFKAMLVYFSIGALTFAAAIAKFAFFNK
jgi:hypothetical protein